VDAARRAAPGLRFSVLGAAAFAAVGRGDLSVAEELIDEAFRSGVPADAPEHSMAHTTKAVILAATDSTIACDFLDDAIDELVSFADEYSAISARAIVGLFAGLAGVTNEGVARPTSRCTSPTDFATPRY